MGDPILDPGKRSSVIVEFLYGLPEKLVSFVDDVVPVAGAYPMPSMDVRVPPNVLSLQQDTAEILLRLDQEDLPAGHVAFLQLFASGRPYPKIYCRIGERTEASDGTAGTIYRFAGFVELAHKNPDGFEGQIRLTVVPLTKIDGDVRLGLSIDATCDNQFGDARCGFALEAAGQPGVLNMSPAGGRLGDFIVAVPGLVVPLKPGTNEQDEFYFTNGSIRFDGLSIRIRAWSLQEPSLFRLARMPPAYWGGRTVTVFPGCLRDRAACIRHGRQISFNGLGVAIPEFDPFSQVPAR